MKRQSSKRPIIHLVITDLDNTLYDWYSSFVPAFYAMVEKAAALLDVDRDELLDELKAVHVQYHNTEQPYSILETPSVKRRFPQATKLERRDALCEAFNAFSQSRKKRLCLFPGVLETLNKIRGSECLIVGYTEAVVENSLYRLSLLDLVPLFQGLYVPRSRSPQHPDPSRRPIEERYPDFVRFLPSEHRKPDPTVIENICKDFRIDARQTLYVGDSMTRDISMAVMAGCHSALASYGGKCPPHLWEQLVRITHWTAEDVKLEERLREDFAGVRPDVELAGFADLLKHFDFGGTARQPSDVSEPDEIMISS